MAYEPKWIKELRKRKGGARVIAKHNRPRAENEGERLSDFIHENEGDYFRLDVPKPMAYVKTIGVPGEHVWRDDTDACVRCGESKQIVLMAAKPDECVPISWWYCDPLGHWNTIPTYRVWEHEDGTITINGVIDNAGPYHPQWRGTLTKGRWAGEGPTVG